MCFSATASFASAALLSVLGGLAVRRAPPGKEMWLAAMPLVFAAQQGIEGLLWLALRPPHDPQLSRHLALAFLVTAQVLWPVYAPLAAMLTEPRQDRRRLMAPGFGLGVAVAAWLAWSLATRPFGASIEGGHIIYLTGHTPLLIEMGYVAATCLPLMMSTQRSVALLGAIVFAGAATTYLVYFDSFISVWCFFGALASGVVLFHFYRAARPYRGLATV